MQSFNPASNLKLRKFADMARDIGTESAEFGMGPHVLAPAYKAYRDTWQRYKNMATDVLSNHSKEDKGRWNIVADFIDDDIRTILMARSIRRAIEALLAENQAEIHVIEAGFGTGFMAAIALGADPRVKVTGYDLHESKIAVAQETCSILGLDEKRFSFQQRNLTENPTWTEQPNVLMVAEHISAGLMHELTTEIPRGFTVDPHFTIPYSVHPQVMMGTERDSPLLLGTEIILADKKTSDYVQISGTIKIPPHKRGTLNVANGITWSGINSILPPIQQKNMRQFDLEGKRNHLLRSTCLHADTDREKNLFWFITNDGNDYAEAQINVSYPIGFLINQKAAPQVKVEGDEKVKVYKSSLSERIFTAYVAGMRRGEVF